LPPPVTLLLEMPSILVVEGHFLVRQGLRHVIGQEYRGVIFGEASTAAEAKVLIARRAWDLITLDLVLPDGDGLSLLHAVRAHRPESRVLVITLQTGADNVDLARQGGASGFVSKGASRAELVKALKAVLANKLLFPATAPPPELPHAVLSHREREVMFALAAGRTINEIAAMFSLSSKTISSFKGRVFAKMGFCSTADLVRYALQHRLM
jgi:two-component system, NarL family, invasion response regulator UvrY